MRMRRVGLSLSVGVAVVLGVGLICPPGFAQQQAQSQPGVVPDTTQVIGFEGVKPNKKGTLSVASGSLEFKHGKEKADVPATLINDVVTGNDSQRAIGGVVGTISMFR